MVVILFYIQYILLYHMVGDVSKLECANHCVKCYRSHLEQLVKDYSHFKSHGNLSKSTIIKIAYRTRCAIHKRSPDRDVEKLRRYLRAGPRHYLGYHELCDSSWCNSVIDGNNQYLDELPVNMILSWTEQEIDLSVKLHN